MTDHVLASCRLGLNALHTLKHWGTALLAPHHLGAKAALVHAWKVRARDLAGSIATSQYELWKYCQSTSKMHA